MWRSLGILLAAVAFSACDLLPAPTRSPESRDDVVGATQGGATPLLLAQLFIEPSELILEPRQTLQLTVRALTLEGHTVPDVTLAWSISSEIGSIDPFGVFTAGTVAGRFAEAIQVAGTSAARTLTARASVTVNPGPVHTVALDAPETELFTGDEVRLSARALDEFGNTVQGLNPRWSASSGSVTDSGVFKAGRSPGEVMVSAQASDGRASAKGEVLLRVAQGYCETRPGQTAWDFEWFAYDNGVIGERLGASRVESGTFDLIWGRGPVFEDRSHRLFGTARAQIVVQREGPISFSIGGDDGFRFRLDGQELIANWSKHSYMARQERVDLAPGIYELEIDYYQWTGLARLDFDVDADVLDWTEAVECFGGYTEPPPNRYFLLDSPGETPERLADRFAIPIREMPHMAPSTTGLRVVPGAMAREAAPKVIVLQGIHSRSSCDDARGAAGGDSVSVRLRQVLRSVQVGRFVNSEQRTLIDAQDFIGFSYADTYESCDALGSRYTGATYPVGSPATAGTVLPIYKSNDTCIGVVAAATHLAGLVRRVAEEDPGAPIVLLGHSLGGMVATYYLTELATPDIRSRLRALVTVDSPLGGDSRTSPGTSCPVDQGSWADIHGDTNVVSQIADAGEILDVRKLYAINSSSIGDVVSGARWWWADCGQGGTLGLLGGVIAFAINPVLALPTFAVGFTAGEIVTGHSCAFFDADALARMADVISGEPPPGFIGAQITSVGPTTVVERESAPLRATVTNTGTTPWRFAVLASSRRPDGRIAKFETRFVELGVGASADVSIPPKNFWGEPGPRDILLEVWTSPNLVTRLAGTGWLLNHVVVKAAPAPVLLPTATPTPTPRPTSTPTPSFLPTPTPSPTPTPTPKPGDVVTSVFVSVDQVTVSHDGDPFLAGPGEIYVVVIASDGRHTTIDHNAASWVRLNDGETAPFAVTAAILQASFDIDVYVGVWEQDSEACYLRVFDQLDETSTFSESLQIVAGLQACGDDPLGQVTFRLSEQVDNWSSGFDEQATEVEGLVVTTRSQTLAVGTAQVAVSFEVWKQTLGALGP